MNEPYPIKDSIEQKLREDLKLHHLKLKISQVGIKS